MPTQTSADRSAVDKAGAHSLTLAALGVVFGDIGTSPLYAIKQCFHDGSAVTQPRVFGVLSLIIWALTIVVIGKYVILLMRADNRGEGGIFALTIQALVATEGRKNRWILIAGLIGGSLFFGDSVLTPAISVLQRRRGSRSQSSRSAAYVIPLTLILLIALFVAQRAAPGDRRLLRPVLIVWFSTLGILGLAQIAQVRASSGPQPLYGIELIAGDP
jgi:KUP system potassium uptake protein